MRHQTVGWRCWRCRSSVHSNGNLLPHTHTRTHTRTHAHARTHARTHTTVSPCSVPLLRAQHGGQQA